MLSNTCVAGWGIKHMALKMSFSSGIQLKSIHAFIHSFVKEIFVQHLLNAGDAKQGGGG